jgi:hypothetical protein
VAEKAEAITEYFLVNTGYLQKELFVEYHFSTALRGMLSLVFSPTTSVDVTSTSGTNKADDVVFDSKQSKPIPKGSQSGVICPPDESIQRKPNSNIKQTKPRGKTRKGVTAPLISKKLPAALQAHQGWDYDGAAILNESEFSSKLDLLDNFLSARVNNYVAEVRQQLQSKLRNNDLECNKLNLFCFLLSSGLDHVMDYLNESLARKGLNKTTTYEFRRFLGSFLLLSSFNLSAELNWNLMQKR